MGIHLKQINVEKAGPISGLQLPLMKFNLVYGMNEQGKTFLVEFVIRSLFDNLSGWSLREADYRGMVELVGLNGEEIALMPSSPNKLEDLLAEKRPGLPAQISKLLVVKGADLSFVRDRRQSIDRDILKEFLSGQGLLDVIQGKIQATVSNSRLEDGQIIGANAGKIKNRNKLQDELEKMDGLFQELESTYSGGERQALEIRARGLEGAISEQEAAKRHQAYRLHQRIQEKQEALGRLPIQDLENLRSSLEKVRESERRIGNQEVKLAELRKESRHYGWLDEAISLYEQQGQPGKGPQPFLLVTAIAALILAVVSSFLEFPVGTVVLALIAAGAGYFYLRQYRSAMESAADSQEIDQLKEEYARRFGQPFSGLPQLKETMKSLEKAHIGAATREAELQEEQKSLETGQDQVARAFSSLLGRNPAREKWEEALNELAARRESLDQAERKLQLELAGLRVAEDDYRSEPAAVEYSGGRLEKLEAELDDVKDQLRGKEADLKGLKQRISVLTGDEINIELETLIEHLQGKREEKAAEYRELTAEIVAGILVSRQLELIRKQEEETIQERLSSPQVIAPIQRITNRYSGISYKDGALRVVYDYGDFALADLSTGALEQVLLGLRLGFAAHILKQDQLFLILDDAFQHADWQRRQRLLQQTVALAKEGWQIVYFTMDDHIKSLFEEAGKQHFAGDYLGHNLAAADKAPQSEE